MSFTFDIFHEILILSISRKMFKFLFSFHKRCNNINRGEFCDNGSWTFLVCFCDKENSIIEKNAILFSIQYIVRLISATIFLVKKFKKKNELVFLNKKDFDFLWEEISLLGILSCGTNRSSIYKWNPLLHHTHPQVLIFLFLPFWRLTKEK